MSVEELGKGGADGLLADASLPGVGNILERIADQVEVDRSDSTESITVRLGFGR